MFQTNNKQDWHELCQRYLAAVTASNTKSCDYSTDDDEGAKSIAMTYGELLYTGFEQIITQFPITRNDVFVDCGSGFGKLCLQAILNTEAKQVVGIELDEALFQLSQQAADNLKADLPPFLESRELRLLQGSFFDFIITEATIMYCGSTCFDDHMMQDIGRWMAQHQHLHTVITLKPLPEFTALPFWGTCTLECTWDSALAYVYRR